MLERLPPKVLAVEFDQVEGAEHGGMVVPVVTDEVEDREPVLTDDDREIWRIVIKPDGRNGLM